MPMLEIMNPKGFSKQKGDDMGYKIVAEIKTVEEGEVLTITGVGHMNLQQTLIMIHSLHEYVGGLMANHMEKLGVKRKVKRTVVVDS